MLWKSAIGAQQQVKDSIPRVQHIPYLHSILEGVAAGFTFDGLRTRLREVATELAQRNEGRVTAARLDDAFTFWSPTAEALGELMYLGLLMQRPLPSRRAAVDAHRGTIYELTPEGRTLGESARGNDSSFRLAITPRLLQAHPYFMRLCEVAATRPLLIPEYTEEELKSFRDTDSWTTALAHDALSRMRVSMPELDTTADEIRDRLIASLSKRYPPEAPKPTIKSLLDTVLDSLVASALRARALALDAITFNVLMSWGLQLRILNESRYVHGFRGRTVWTTAEIANSSSGAEVTRRGMAVAGEQVAAELPRSYRVLADAVAARVGGSAVRHPYIEIYKVRALVAFRCRVNDPVVDAVIGEVNDRSRVAPYMVEVALGDGRSWQAVSESPFLLAGRRFYVMFVKDLEGGT